MRKTVLLCDNHPQFLDTRAEYLELAGYNVIKAVSLDLARKAIANANIHLTILDVRMVNDIDDLDKSGLEIAIDPSLRFIPSIILTDFPTVDDVRDVLRPGKSNAVDYIFKIDGPQKMVEAVGEAFEKHVAINWDLTIEWDEESGLSIPGLIGILQKNIQANHDFSILNDEVEDLLRMVFYEYDEVTILRKLWVDTNRIALLTQARQQRSERYFVLTFGNVASIEAEVSGQQFFPDKQGEGGTVYIQSSRRTHYAANLWRLRGVKTDELEALDDAAAALKEGALGNVIETLFGNTLGIWHNQSEPCELAGNSVDFYRQLSPLCRLSDGRVVFQQRVNAIAREARRLNLVNALLIEEGCLKIKIGSRMIDLPDPSTWLFDPASFSPDSIYYTENSPGKLDLDTILLGADNLTWLTDLAQAGEYPVWHDYARMETELRFNLLETINLGDIYELECQLKPAWPVDLHDTINGNAEKRKVGNAILRVREQAYQAIQHAPTQYAQCLLFNAAAELLENEPPIMRGRKDTARLVHRLMLSGLICADMGNIIKEPPRRAFLPLVVNEVEKIVCRGDKVIDVPETEFRLLCYLYKNAGKTCARETICHEVFNIQDKPEFNQLHNQIDTNLNRLRDKIEPDPKSPHYIITLHGVGVRLVTNPKEDSTE